MLSVYEQTSCRETMIAGTGRWIVSVSEEADIAVRSFIGQCGLAVEVPDLPTVTVRDDPYDNYPMAMMADFLVTDDR